MPRISDVTKPAVVVHNLRKTFKVKHTHSFKETFIGFLKRKELTSDFNALEGVSFSVDSGESVAILGYNGSGKSTTLKLISGVLAPDAGWVRTRGRVAGLIEVGAGFHPDLTGRENVYLNAAILGMSKREVEERFEQIVEFSEIGEFIDNEVKHYSSGMFLRLAFSVAIHTELDVLLVDEILSVGDAPFREKCRRKIRELIREGKTMIVVSHDIGTVRDLCDRGIVLSKGKLVFDGDVESAVDHLSKHDVDGSGEPLSFTVGGGIKTVWERARSRFGRPIGPETKVAANGVGWFQQFEHGMITYSKELKRGQGLTNGPILDTYLSAGGPAGAWGFIAVPGMEVADGLAETVRFQNGSAIRRDEGTVSFQKT